MASKTLNVARLAQANSSWKNTTLGYGPSTIGTSGCTLTSFTMIYDYWVSSGESSGPSMTPADMNNVCKIAGAFSGDNLNVSTAAQYFGFTIDWTYSSAVDYEESLVLSDVISLTKSAIDQNKPMLIGIYNPDQYMHYVVAYKYSGDTIYIRDPGSSNKTTLQKYTDDGFHVFSCRSFKKK